MEKSIKEIKNLENLINVAKEEYIHTFERSNKLESKVSILMAFVAVFISILIENFKFLYNFDVNEDLIYNKIIFTRDTLNLISFLLVIYSTICFLRVLLSIKIGRIDSNKIFAEKRTKQKYVDYLKFLIYKYNENITYNNSILTKKYKSYDRAVLLLIITVILIIISYIISNIFLGGL